MKKTELENVIQVKERENLEFSDKCTKLIQDLQVINKNYYLTVYIVNNVKHSKETEERAKKSLEGEYNAKLADLVSLHWNSVKIFPKIIGKALSECGERIDTKIISAY